MHYVSVVMVLVLLMVAPTPSPAAAAPQQATPEGRVRAFIEDYFQLHARSRAIFDNADFDAWGAAVAGLDQAHFVAGAHSGLDGLLSSRPVHAPDSERILGSLAQDDEVVIQTLNPDVAPTWFEYRLRRVDGDWRIARLRQYAVSPDEPFMPPDQRDRFRNPRTLPLRRASDSDGFDGNAMFSSGRRVNVAGGAGTITVRRVGTLNVGTGLLVAADPGYHATSLAPLARRVAPGRYPVDIAAVGEQVGALRLLLSDAPVVKWYPAESDGNGHVIGVDSGALGICDVAALLAVTARHKEQRLEAFAESGAAAGAAMLSLVDPDDCVVASTGGDGGFPAYWGVDRSGAIAALLVDMLVLPRR